MASINFYLKEPKSDKETPIMAMLSADGNRYKLYTGEKVSPEQWLKEKHRVKKNHTGSVELNARLGDIERTLPKVYLSIINDGKSLSFSQVNDVLKASIQFNKPQKKIDLLKIYDEFMEEKALQIKVLTLKKYKTLKKILSDFSQSKHRKMEFELIDNRFDIAFRGYLQNDLNQVNDTVSKYYDCLKVFLGWASERGYNKNSYYKEFEAKRSKTDVIYLTEPELMTLYHLDITSNTRLTRIRDLFCFQCLTGQRFSDIDNMKWIDVKENLNGFEWHLYQIKGNKTKKVIVPLSYYALEILNRLRPLSDGKSKVFPLISLQKANEYIKELAKLAGIDELTSTVKYSGKKRIEKTEPKYEFISTHTARRTFVTLSLEKGMRPETVQEITGHEDYRTMKKYIKITDKVKAIELHNIWSKTTIVKDS